MSPLIRACSIWVNLRSGMGESFEAPSMRFTQPRAAGAGELHHELGIVALHGAQHHGRDRGQRGGVFVVAEHADVFEPHHGLDADLGGQLGAPLAGEGFEGEFQDAAVFAGERRGTPEVVDANGPLPCHFPLIQNTHGCHYRQGIAAVSSPPQAIRRRQWTAISR